MTEVDYRKVTGLVHSTESFGSVDGPGVRFVVFMQGCHMRCQYCHNPDTWDLVNPAATERTAEDVLNEALRFRMFWGKEGGITVSGGEATIQIDFLIALFTLAKEKGIHTTLDTCALTFRPTERYLEKYNRLMEVTDLVLLDGHSNKTILECARYLSDIGKPVWIRHVLVPNLTDRDEDLIELAKFVKTLNNVERFEVLPYHNLGEFKWRELGRPYPLEGTKPPTRARVENAKALMKTETYQEYLNRIKG